MQIKLTEIINIDFNLVQYEVTPQTTDGAGWF